MTADAKNTPISVDYTGRDYYALREQLIARVQDRVPTWLGNDPSDFGLALVESFAYMGDLLNYYIDRVANESYLLTATQRESLLNIAAMYGYRPSTYVSAMTELTINSSQGYLGNIKAVTIESGDAGGGLEGSYAKLIVPNDHPFKKITSPRTSGDYDTVIVRSVPNPPSSTLGGEPISYEYSVFNGTFPVAYIGYNNYGSNVVWYRPEATPTNITPKTAAVTAAVASGTTVTYTADNDFVAGQKVTITGFTSTGFNLTNVAIATVSATNFTVTNSLSAATATGTGTATIPTGFVVTLSNTNRTIDPLENQKVVITGVTVGGGENGYNGVWKIKSAVAGSDTVATSFTVDAVDTAKKIRKAVDLGTTFVYSSWSDFVQGQKVSITGVKTSTNSGGTANTEFNFDSTTTTSVKKIIGVVTDVLTTGSNVTFRISEALEVGDIISVFNIVSVGNEDGVAGSGYNYQDISVASIDTITANITGVEPDDNIGLGEVTFTTSSDHSFEAGDYVTLSGITPSDYNMKSVQIKSVSNRTFTVEAYWTDPWVSAESTSATATLYTATVASSVTGAESTTGTLICWQFKTADGSRTPGTWATSADALATPLIGGTEVLTSAKVYYADLPAVSLVNTGQVLNVGETVIPVGTQVTTQVSLDGGVRDVIFSTTADVTVPFRESASIAAKHGEDVSVRTENAAVSGGHDINGELLGYSNGTANQSFSLKEVEVSTRSVRVFVDNGTVWEEWTQVEHVQDFASTSQVFQVDVSASDAVSVTFGDGISGKIPSADSGIKAVYIAGGGVIGNVGAGSLTTWGIIPGLNATTIRSSMTVTNETSASGGSDPETNDSIRYNAPRALRSLNRAVTLEDFANLALTVDGVGKAKSIGTSRSSVTVYIAPAISDNSGDQTPGYLENDVETYSEVTTQMTDLITQTEDYLADKKQIGTSLTILPPVYSKVSVGVSFSYLNQYNKADVESAIKKKILDDFSYNNLDLGDVITPEELEFKLRQVDGVTNIKVTSLFRGSGNGRNSLVGAEDEIFVFTEGAITLTAQSSESAMSSFISTAYADADGAGASSTPTITPAFNRNVFSYNISVINGTESIVVVPTAAAGATASITVNDKAVASAGSSTINLVISGEPTPNILVSVTAPDGVTVTTYKFKVTIASA